MDKTKETLKDQFKKLPKDIREAILAVDLKPKMQFITKKNNLHINQAEALENEAVFVLLGLEHPNDIIENIAGHVEVSKEKAEMIAEDLNREIFLKVRESLKKIFEKREEDGEGSSLLGGSLSADEAGLLVKTGEKTEEDELDREKILREIEDKEHHNLPSANKTERHLEIPFPNEIVNLETKRPSEIGPKITNLSTEQTSFKKMENVVQVSTQNKTISPLTKQTRVPLSSAEMEAIKTMPKDIIKAKMGETVRLPKKTIEVGDSISPPKAEKQDVGKKIDPYRESVV